MFSNLHFVLFCNIFSPSSPLILLAGNFLLPCSFYSEDIRNEMKLIYTQYQGKRSIIRIRRFFFSSSRTHPLSFVFVEEKVFFSKGRHDDITEWFYNEGRVAFSFTSKNIISSSINEGWRVGGGEGEKI
jgi:hypothetical protein